VAVLRQDAQGSAMTSPSASTIPGIDLTRLNELRDYVSRRTPPNDGELHQLLAEIDKLVAVAAKLEVDRQKAWGDADHAAWRASANASYQSFLTMNGVTAFQNHGRVYASDGDMVSAMNEAECTTRSTRRLGDLAQLAEEAAVAMLRRDRARREAKR
jgi:hypothetical protein